jgi:flagellin
MLGINSNINSLVAQQNLSGTQNALSQAITRLSSGKRINSAADDAAGLAISTGMQTQINGLNQGVSNANDGVSMVQTASSGLTQITASLQRIRTLAVQASNGGLSADNRAALQQEVTQQIAEVNRIASQTQYNGKNILDGSAGNVSFQVGANVGQTVSLNLSQNMSAASLGTGAPLAGQTLGTYTGLSLNGDGSKAVAGSATVSITGASSTNASSVTVTGGAGAATYQDNTGGHFYAQDSTGKWYSNTTAALAATSAQNKTAADALSTTTDAGTIAALNQASQSVTVTAGAGTVSIVAGSNTAGGITPAGTTSISATNDGKGNLTVTDNAGNYYVKNVGGSGDWYMSTSASGAATLATADAQGAANDITNSGKDAGTVSALNSAVATAAANVTSSVTTPAAITSINVLSDGKGGFTFTDQNNQALATNTVSALFGANTAQGKISTAGLDAVANASTDATVTSQINTLNKPSTVASIDISTAQGASMAMESIGNALNDVNNLQATLGAAQNRFSAIASAQAAQSTDLSTAQSNIQDANFAQETANLSKAQVLQQAGISVLAQANSLPQQVLKLLG